MEFLCPACHSKNGRLVETVPIRAIATAWADGTNHGEGRTADQISTWISEDIGATQISFRQCMNCGLEIAQPQRSWSSEHYPQTKHFLGFDHIEALAVLEKLPPASILDIGCADGQFLEAANAQGHRSVGIDFTRADIAAAQGRGLDARVADVAELANAYPAGHKFDVVTLFQVIEHLNDPDAIFSQIATVTAPGGRLFVGCPSDRRYTRRFNQPQRINRSDFWDYPPQHTLRWTVEALERFLPRHGWQIEKVTYEPLQIVGAAAHIAHLYALAHHWPLRGLRRRAASLYWMGRVVASRLFTNTTGLRVVVEAKHV